MARLRNISMDQWTIKRQRRFGRHSTCNSTRLTRPLLIEVSRDRKMFHWTADSISKASRLPIPIIRVYNGGLEGVLGSGGFDAEAIHGGVSLG